jgi:hypothetical protein
VLPEFREKFRQAAAEAVTVKLADATIGAGGYDAQQPGCEMECTGRLDEASISPWRLKLRAALCASRRSARFS